jgi:HPr kinase/phosphorylase
MGGAAQPGGGPAEAGDPDAGLDARPAEARRGEKIVHASTVAHAGRALVILGPSGAGKSSLAMQLIGLGARLVADDRTALTLQGGRVLASPPPAIAGLIEARGLGLLRLPHLQGVPVHGVLDLGRTERARLPQARATHLLGQRVVLYFHAAGAHFPPALLHCLAGRREEPDPDR